VRRCLTLPGDFNEAQDQDADGNWNSEGAAARCKVIAGDLRCSSAALLVFSMIHGRAMIHAVQERRERR